jgi:hypothetical protein
MATAIAFPFTLDSKGRIRTTTDDSDIYMGKIRTVLSTAVLQKPMDPLFGFDMGRSLYENMGNFVPAIKESIYRALGRALPNVRIIDIRFSPIQDVEYPQYSINILVSLPNGEDGSIAINSSVFSSNGTISGSIQ